MKNKNSTYFNQKLSGLKKIVPIMLLLAALLGCTKSYLDVVPDNVPTLDHAFANRYEAEKYLYTCYSYLPTVDLVSNVLFFGTDDMWTWFFNHHSYQSPWKIARGEQNVVSPLVNAWNGENHAKPMFNAIRDCNIFLENVADYNKVPDLDPQMRKRWIAEGKFLKAYYHFYLFRMYGPIPIVDVNLPISASPDEVKVKRQPVDKVVDFIATLLDEAAVDLPPAIQKQNTEAGRVTRAAALMLKAKLLVTAASPLFNGNADYANFKDKDNIALFNPVYQDAKWKRAADACAAALDGTTGVKLYEFSPGVVKVSDTTRIQMNIRGSVTEKWNSELIWGRSVQNTNEIQRGAMADNIDPTIPKPTYSGSYFSVTMSMAERFYSDKGVPINEDKTWDYARRYEVKVAEEVDRFNLQPKYTTAKLNFNRENRFYASLGFDGGRWYLQSNTSDLNSWVINAKFGQLQGKQRDMYFNETGYWPKKLVNWKFVQTTTSYSAESYPWPEMRLADLYLLYAEALNEIGMQPEAIVYLDLIRKRAGLKGVAESWMAYSNRPNKYTNKDGLREIIQQEREIELAFEGSRLWDLRRWKTAEVLQNKNVQGWDIYGKTTTEYYRLRTLWNQEFISPRDYLWPLKEDELLKNPNLVQNPGW